MRQNLLNSVAHIDFISHACSLLGQLYLCVVPDPEQQRCTQMKMTWFAILICLPMLKQKWCHDWGGQLLNYVRETTEKDNDHDKETNDGKVPHQRGNQDINDFFYL